tara:strand:- start:15463 stop:16254 length:792 start_codon:yes stop_codon:yes gene_type:complete
MERGIRIMKSNNKNVIFLWSGKVTSDGEFCSCIKSLKKVSDCKITVATPQLTKSSVELLKSLDVEIKYFDKSLWDNRRMTCKIEQVNEHLKSLNENDFLFVYDGDMLFLKDPFGVFLKEFDFLYTTRQTTPGVKEWVQTNGGCIGFKNNKRARNFLNFFVDNLNNPFWQPYINFRKNHPHNNDLSNLDWWVDQDFSNCIHTYKNEVNNGELGFDVKVYDAGPKYNFVCKGQEILNEIKNKDKYVLHCKTASFNRWIGGISIDE